MKPSLASHPAGAVAARRPRASVWQRAQARIGAWCVLMGVLLAASSAAPAAALTPEQSAFMASLVAGARGTQDQFGVPASITMAQAILESGWGGSTLSKPPNNNLFGIKCGTTPSPYQSGCVTVPTQEFINGQWVTVLASFRTYTSVSDSILDHGYYLRFRGIYDAAFAVSYSPRQFAVAIAAAGYATDPNYPRKLLTIASSYDLYSADFGQTVGSAIADPRASNLTPQAAQVNRTGAASTSAPLDAKPTIVKAQPPEWVTWGQANCPRPAPGQAAEQRSCP